MGLPHLAPPIDQPFRCPWLFSGVNKKASDAPLQKVKGGGEQPMLVFQAKRFAWNEKGDSYACLIKTEEMPPARLSHLTLVIVEDHDDARNYLALFLTQSGAKVVLAKDAYEGLAAIKKNKPELVLTDIRMPEMDGFELLRKVRALGPDFGGNVPVIAMSALFARTDRRRVLDAGFQACLPKPFTPNKLLDKILEVLGR